MDMKIKRLEFVNDGVRKALRGFPRPVRVQVGYALHVAQQGETAEEVKPLKGFSGSGVLEVVSNHDGDTYRAVYTVKLADVVYVLHAFQKKAKRGIATPKHDMDVIRRRLKQAEELHQQRSG